MATAVASSDGRVSGEGWISDDSSFYGDEDVQSRLQAQCAEFVPDRYWEYHDSLPQTMARAALQPDGPSAPTKPPRFNYFEGQETAWQLDEPVDSFLSRLPPSTTTSETSGPWLWVGNPYADRPGGDEDKAQLMAHGTKLLDEFEQFKHVTEGRMAGKATAAITRATAPRRRELEHALRAAATTTRCTSGKWMLFLGLADVDRTWRAVVEGVSTGRLGTAAKVATESAATASSGSDAAARLICVYTRDFGDRMDVRRVLLALVDMGVVSADATAKWIYYKCDAYSYLGIDRSNEYGLRASLYSSQDVLKWDDG